MGHGRRRVEPLVDVEVMLVTPYYQDGAVTLYNADYLQAMAGIAAESVGMMLADLPYGETRNEWDVEVSLPDLWREWRRIRKPTAAAVMFCQGAFTVDLIQSNRAEYRYSLVWEKDRVSGFLNAAKMPLRCHEDIAVFYAQQPTYNPQTWKGERTHGRGHHQTAKQSTNYGAYKPVPANDGTDKQPRSVLYFKRPHPPVHPTEKPVDLCAWLIRTYSNPGDVVLDPCVGSGPALRAASLLGRRAIGSETRPDYCSLAASRFEQPALPLDVA